MQFWLILFCCHREPANFLRLFTGTAPMMVPIAPPTSIADLLQFWGPQKLRHKCSFLPKLSSVTVIAEHELNSNSRIKSGFRFGGVCQNKGSSLVWGWVLSARNATKKHACLQEDQHVENVGVRRGLMPKKPLHPPRLTFTCNSTCAFVACSIQFMLFPTGCCNWFSCHQYTSH